MTILKNIITSYVTSLIGLAIIICTSIACIYRDMNFIWEGFAGLFAGAVFVFLSDKEVKHYLKVTIDFLLKKLVGK